MSSSGFMRFMFLVLTFVAATVCVTGNRESNANGVYDGTMTFKDLGSYGDFGIGTFETLDGEMMELDGQFYQVKSDGVAYNVSDSMKTPLCRSHFLRAGGVYGS
jgi:alpha-acetolactate decarboxylase